MLRAQRTLHSDRLRRERLDHRSDILSAAFAGHHEIMEGLRPLEHDHIIGEEKENALGPRQVIWALLKCMVRDDNRELRGPLGR